MTGEQKKLLALLKHQKHTESTRALQRTHLFAFVYSEQLTVHTPLWMDGWMDTRRVLGQLRPSLNESETFSNQWLESRKVGHLVHELKVKTEREWGAPSPPPDVQKKDRIWTEENLSLSEGSWTRRRRRRKGSMCPAPDNTSHWTPSITQEESRERVLQVHTHAHTQIHTVCVGLTHTHTAQVVHQQLMKLDWQTASCLSHWSY